VLFILPDIIIKTTEMQPLIPQAQGTKSADRVPIILMPEGKGTPMRKQSGARTPMAASSLRSRGWPSNASKK